MNAMNFQLITNVMYVRYQFVLHAVPNEILRVFFGAWVVMFHPGILIIQSIIPVAQTQPQNQTWEVDQKVDFCNVSKEKRRIRKVC